MSKTHVVAAGECLSSIADQNGLPDYETIYDAPENAEFRKLRPDPHVIMAGDKIFIPDDKRQPYILETGKRHRIIRKRPRRQIRLKLDLPEGTSFAGQPFELEVGTVNVPGKVTSENLVEAKIPVTPNEVTLSLPEAHLTINLAVGHLDPLHDGDANHPVPSGVQARLRNLGLYAGPLSGKMDEETMEAVRRFQEEIMEREEPDGQLDDDTYSQLLEKHGC